LKTLIDSEYSNYKDKPVLLAGVSDGNFGGARAVNAIIPVLRRISMYIVNSDILIRNVKEVFDANGELVDLKLPEFMAKGIQELLRVQNLLKP
jgi:NAD(P)H-dependent FMN reductase